MKFKSIRSLNLGLHKILKKARITKSHRIVSHIVRGWSESTTGYELEKNLFYPDTFVLTWNTSWRRESDVDEEERFINTIMKLLSEEGIVCRIEDNVPGRHVKVVVPWKDNIKEDA